MILEFYKMRKGVLTPKRAHPSDAGLDIFYYPEKEIKKFDSNKEVEISKPVKGTCFTKTETGEIQIGPKENAIIPTGIKVGVPHGYMLQVCNRGSVGAKKNLIFGAHIIDAGYDGEIFIDLHNIGMETQIIQPGDKIAQLVLTPCISFRLQEKMEDTLYEYPIAISNRKDGKLDSTNEKTKEEQK